MNSLGGLQTLYEMWPPSIVGRFQQRQGVERQNLFALRLPDVRVSSA